jgi:hypothetical protein
MNHQACATVKVDPGICGFACEIRACRVDRRTCRLEVVESGCDRIEQVAGRLETVTMREIFLPMDRNPVFAAVQRAGCHAACPVPVAVIKAAEVALGLALPAPVRIDFTAEPDRS